MKVLFKIIVTVLVLLLVLAGLSRLYDFALRHNMNTKVAYVQKAKIDADIVVHGQCEVLWMISPEILDKQTGLKSYNLALSHSDYADNFLHFYLYLKHNKAPRFLFLYVTPEAMDLKYNTFNTYRFAAFLDDPVVDSVVAECDSAYHRWTWLPFMKYAYYSNKVNFEALQGMKHYFSGRNTAHFADGYEPPFELKWDNHLEEFIQLYPNGYNFEWNKTREKYLRKIISLAQKNGTEVLLYESPVLKEALAYQPNRNEWLSRLKKLGDEYGVEYVLFDKMDIANSRKYYMSTLNLNIEGSAIFTDSLGKFIKDEIIH
jgi:hypothetical protein